MAEFRITNILVQRANASTWTSQNPTLLDGEIGFERDTYKLKVGNGVDDWNTLPYITGSGGGGGGFTQEQIEDIINNLIVAGTGITKVYNDAGNTLTLSITDEVFTSAEKTKLSNIEDGAQVNPTDSEIVQIINNEIGSTDWQTPLSQEQVQDFMASALTGGSQTNITVTYNDASNVFDFFVTSGGGGGVGLTQEEIEDLVAGFIINGTGLSKVYDDVTGQLTLSLSNEIFTTSEKNKLAGIETGATADQLAADVPIADVGGNFLATNVESALLELFNNKVGLESNNIYTAINHFNSVLTSGDSGLFLGENEGVSGIRWKFIKNQGSDKLELQTQNLAATTYSGTYTTRYTLDDSGSPVDGTDIITKAYGDANYLGGTDNLGNHIATQDLNMAENNIINSGIIYVNGTATTANDFVIGRSNTGSYFYDEESFNSTSLGYFEISASTGSGTYTGNFDVVNGVLSEAGAPVIVSNVSGVSGAAIVSNFISVSQSEYDAIVTPDPNTVYYIEDAIDYSTPISSTSTAIDMGYWGGNYVSMASANTATTYTTLDPQLGGWAKVRINAASQPTVTGATLITGSTFIPSTDMYMYVTYNGTTTEYWFEEI